MDLLDGIKAQPGRFWVGVACAAHVARGRAEGFMQLGHGTDAPLRRLGPGDGIVYYSPTRDMGVADGYQSFTAIGFVRDDSIYRGDMGGGFTPSRRDVDWLDGQHASIHPLRDSLSFTAGRSNWGYAMRRGLVPATADDFALIRKAMNA